MALFSIQNLCSIQKLCVQTTAILLMAGCAATLPRNAVPVDAVTEAAVPGFAKMKAIPFSAFSSSPAGVARALMARAS